METERQRDVGPLSGPVAGTKVQYAHSKIEKVGEGRQRERERERKAGINERLEKTNIQPTGAREVRGDILRLSDGDRKRKAANTADKT